MADVIALNSSESQTLRDFSVNSEVTTRSCKDLTNYDSRTPPVHYHTITVPIPSEIEFAELHLPRPTVTSTSNTEVIEKHTWRKQTEKKGKKYSYVVGKPDSELKNVGHTTPMSRRNVSSSLSSNVANKSRMSVFPAPAPAPAHSAPTQSGGQNGVRSLRNSRLHCVGLMILAILARD